MDFILIFLLLVLNGLFAMYEIALVSSKRVRMSIEADRGNKAAQRVLRQMEKPEQTLSAIQIGITLIGILSGALGGMTIASDVEPLFENLPYVSNYAQQFSVVTTIVVITYLSLVIGELVPKALALNNPEGYALKLSLLISVVTKLFYPAVAVLSSSTKLIQRILGVKETGNGGMSGEELKMIVKQSGENGKLLPGQSDLLKGAINLTDKRICELMTPRHEMVVLPLSYSRKEILDTITKYNYSRYILTGKNKDDVRGIVLVKDVLKLLFSTFSDNPRVDLTSIAISPLYLPENVSALKAIRLFREKSTKIGVVIDEYGGIEGLVTLQDLTESIFGTVGDEDNPSEEMVKNAGKGIYIVDGSANIDDILEELGIPTDKEIANTGFTTIGGLSMYFIGRLPKVGDTFTYMGSEFKVMDMDGERVAKILVKTPIESRKL